MKFSNRQTCKIGFSYSLITLVSNIYGVMISNLLMHPGIRSSCMDEWVRFRRAYFFQMNLLELVTYIIPSILCFLYLFCCKKNRERKLINLPIYFAAIGTTGWLIYLIEEFIVIPIACNLGFLINVKRVVFHSILNNNLELIASFTLAYFLMDLYHKNFFFPKYYPDADFINMKKLKRFSMKFLFIVNYISVAFLPVVFSYVTFISVLRRNGIKLDEHIPFMIGMILILGIVVTIAFSKSVHKPMVQFKERIQKLKDGDFDSKVYILSNDEFGELGKIFNAMTDAISRRNKKIEKMQYSVIESLAVAVEGKDSSTGGHIKRTSGCVKVFIDKLKTVDVYDKISNSFYDAVVITAPMHDLGKLYVDDKVLKKNGKFTEEEYEEMKKHSSEGAKVVAGILRKHENEEFKKIAENIAHYHHEKWNGTGYPENLRGTEIPLEARIMALADVFDALISKRCYKESFGFNKSFEIIKESLGTHFDPELGKIFISCRPELEKLYSVIA